MHLARLTRVAILCVLMGAMWGSASAQTAESVGSRALGMGGAFVAVASDSSATWWNPAGLAAGPFLDLALARSTIEVNEGLPAWRQTVSWFALATPPVGISYYRFRITDIQPFDPTAQVGPDREDRRAGVPVNSLSGSHLGITLVQTLIPGVHAGATLKYVRGTFHAGRDDGVAAPADLLDRGDALDEGDTENRFDLDVGLLAVAGPLRFGAQVRNVREPEFGRRRLPRQARLGVAFDPEPVTGLPLTIALDWDMNTYFAASGPRRVVALGAEQWFRNRRLGIRAGGRVNTVGAEERAMTAGASIAIRPALYIEGHVVRGGAAGERGWSLGARTSY
ncbi:MAG: hypothetical protein ACRD3C_18950 [Vicinamibacterales bacterium]